jgi:hypothetical protein
MPPRAVRYGVEGDGVDWRALNHANQDSPGPGESWLVRSPTWPGSGPGLPRCGRSRCPRSVRWLVFPCPPAVPHRARNLKNWTRLRVPTSSLGHDLGSDVPGLGPQASLTGNRELQRPAGMGRAGWGGSGHREPRGRAGTGRLGQFRSRRASATAHQARPSRKCSRRRMTARSHPSWPSSRRIPDHPVMHASIRRSPKPL